MQNTTTDASYNGSFSLDDSGNNVFLPGFATGTYNITFDLSGTEGVTYKLTGTQTVDYSGGLATSYYNDNGVWTANSTIDLTYVQKLLYYNFKITMNDEGTRLCALDNSNHSALKVSVKKRKPPQQISGSQDLRISGSQDAVGPRRIVVLRNSSFTMYLYFCIAAILSLPTRQMYDSLFSTPSMELGYWATVEHR